MSSASQQPEFRFSVKYSGKDIAVTGLTADDSLGSLKRLLQAETGVAPERMRLLGLKGRQLSDESAELGTLGVKRGSRLMLIGSSEAQIQQVTEEKREEVKFVEDDEEYCDGELKLEERPEYLEKIQRRIREYKITELRPPRPGKKLLVMDIDYTFFDHKSVGSHIDELTRPFVHHFFSAVHPHYDIAVWSATSMRWINSKLSEMRLFNSEQFSVCLLLDSLACISVYSEEEEASVNVKPLAVIWGLYPQWSAANTIMIDDIRRNFAMNPQSGLRIRAFRRAHENKEDRELVKLAEYLVAIAELDDFAELNHRRWEKYVGKDRKKRARMEDADRPE